MEVNGITFSEIVDVYDIHGYDREVEVLGYDKAGNEYAAIGMESVGELVEIYEDTIELVTYSDIDPDESEDIPNGWDVDVDENGPFIVTADESWKSTWDNYVDGDR